MTEPDLPGDGKHVCIPLNAEVLAIAVILVIVFSGMLDGGSSEGEE